MSPLCSPHFCMVLVLCLWFTSDVFTTTSYCLQHIIFDKYNENKNVSNFFWLYYKGKNLLNTPSTVLSINSCVCVCVCVCVIFFFYVYLINNIFLWLQLMLSTSMVKIHTILSHFIYQWLPRVGTKRPIVTNTFKDNVASRKQSKLN